jgi:AraC-like DNA-binding protein
VVSIDSNNARDKKMKHWYAKPHKLLTEYVRTILILEGFSKPDANNLPVFTNGMPTFFCRTESKDHYESVTQLTLFGKSPSDVWTLNKQATIIAYFFKPFTVASVFNISANKLSETPLDLSIWNPHKYTALKTQLIYATDTARKLEVLDILLIQQLNQNRQVCKIIQYATDQIMNNSSKEIISEILVALDLTERTFQRMFKKYVGITPTQYRRICQFQQSFGQLREKKFNKISEIVYDNGFADQSHFIRSFKEFTETTPNDYLKKGLRKKKD